MGTPLKFIRKADPCEAIKFDGTSSCALAIECWSSGAAGPMGIELHVHTSEGTRVARPGDWIVRSDAGFWVCPDSIFSDRYEVAA